MAYDRNYVFELSKQVATEHNLFFIEDIVAYLPCTKSTFYDYFPPNSDELNELKALLERNRVSLKVSMRKKWQDSPAPALQMALMKLIASDDELRRLSMSYSDVTTGGDKIATIPVLNWTTPNTNGDNAEQ